MQTIIGEPKQFIIIERNELIELEKEVSELSITPGMYSQGRGNGIKFVLQWLKDHNIYNDKDFHYLH